MRGGGGRQRELGTAEKQCLGPSVSELEPRRQKRALPFPALSVFQAPIDKVLQIGTSSGGGV